MMFPSFDYKKESTMFPFSLSFARDKYINTYRDTVGAYQCHHRETAMMPADANWGGSIS